MCCEKALTEASRQAGDATICVECDTLAGTEKPVTGNPMNCRSLDANPGCGPNDAFGQVAIPSLPGRIERFGVSGTNGIERALLKIILTTEVVRQSFPYYRNSSVASLCC